MFIIGIDWCGEQDGAMFDILRENFQVAKLYGLVTSTSHQDRAI